MILVSFPRLCGEPCSNKSPDLIHFFELVLISMTESGAVQVPSNGIIVMWESRKSQMTISGAGSTDRCNTPLVTRSSNAFQDVNLLGLRFTFT